MENLGICLFAMGLGDSARWDKLSKEQAVAIVRYRLSQQGITDEDELAKYDKCAIDGWDHWSPGNLTHMPWISLRDLEKPFDQSICDKISARSEEFVKEGLIDDSQDTINMMRAAGMNPNEDTIRRYERCGYPKRYISPILVPILATAVGLAIYFMTRKS